MAAHRPYAAHKGLIFSPRTTTPLIALATAAAGVSLLPLPSLTFAPFPTLWDGAGQSCAARGAHSHGGGGWLPTYGHGAAVVGSPQYELQQ